MTGNSRGLRRFSEQQSFQANPVIRFAVKICLVLLVTSPGSRRGPVRVLRIRYVGQATDRTRVQDYIHANDLDDAYVLQVELEQSVDASPEM
jgi:hypothetical protein